MNARCLWVLLVAAIALPACASRPPVTPDTADDYVDQEGFASTRADGPGNPAPGGFYGTGPSPSPVVHQPASAQPGGHQPY